MTVRPLRSPKPRTPLSRLLRTVRHALCPGDEIDSCCILIVFHSFAHCLAQEAQAVALGLGEG